MRRIIAVTALAALTLVAAPAAAQATEGCYYEVRPPYPANLWIRSGPGTGYDVVGSAGYLETIWGSCQSQGGWVRVGADDGMPGWAYRPYLHRVSH
ncbi:hypothetical protein [Nonomuraea soli]|uniref:Uncharacterized protein YraI n=1 Tax=Nonomuraea soli TaxID=1032476 RepID=A0A7W0CS63_9ACTN|nr:hypothetical protein [Nonomuraea soli]MBA2896312.1 uncharacterized protein YraI [Nonomuraea soli]